MSNASKRQHISSVVAAMVISIFAVATFAQQPERPPQIVKVAEVLRAELAPTVSVPGTIFSRDEVQIMAGVGGLLTQVLEPGMMVKANEVVAKIDPTTLRLQREEQRALHARTEIQAKQLENDYRRQEGLSATKAVSEFQLEQTKANWDLAIADGKIIAVRIRQIEDQIRRATARAPFDGIVAERNHRAGEEVNRGTALVRLTSLKNVEVRAFIPLKYFKRVAEGKELSIFNSGQRAVAVIRAVIPTGDVRSQTFEARLDIPVDSELFTIGELVSVAIPVEATSSSLVVPRDAVVLRNDGNYVMRINAENIAERVPVELGDSSGELIAVKGELREGDKVAVRGGETLSDGAAVQVAG